MNRVDHWIIRSVIRCRERNRYGRDDFDFSRADWIGIDL